MAILINPTVLFTAPLLLQKITNDYLNQCIQDYKTQKIPVPPSSELIAAPCEKTPKLQAQLFQAFSRLLGNRLHTIVVGGGAVQEREQVFIRNCFKETRLVIGYGTTESGNIQFGAQRIGSIDYILLDLPELGFNSTDKPYPRGELCVNTPNMFGGYWKDPEKTKAAFILRNNKNYFRTGDIVEAREDEFRIVGRQKETVKLSNAEWVQVDELERLYFFSGLQQLWIHPDVAASKLVAVVVVHPSVLKKEQKSTPSETKAHLYHYFLREFERIAQENALQGYQRICGVVLEIERKWTVENHHLNSSFKLNRATLRATYLPEVNRVVQTVVSNEQGLLSTLGAASQHTKKSLDAVNLVKTLAKRNIFVTVDQVMKQENISELSHLIHASSLHGPATQPKTIDEDSKLDADIFPDRNQVAETRRGEAVFLTGGTGYIGEQLLAVLSKNTNLKKIFVLVRSSAKKAQELASADQRITLLQGDLEQSNLGLSPDDVALLESQADTIIHMGAFVNLARPYSDLRTANVEATRFLLRVCTRGRAKRFLFTSSTDVFNSKYKGAFEEKELSQSQEYLAGGYGASKVVCERLLHQAAERGLETSILRLCLVTGDSVSGRGNSTDFGGSIFQGFLNSETVPETGESNFPLSIPVDIVCKTIAHLISRETVPKVLNVVNPNSLIKFQKFLEIAAPTATRVTYTDWRAKLPFNAPLSEYFDPKSQQFPLFSRKSIVAENFVALLKEMQLSIPPYDVLFQGYLQYFLSQIKN